RRLAVAFRQQGQKRRFVLEQLTKSRRRTARHHIDRDGHFVRLDDSAWIDPPKGDELDIRERAGRRSEGKRDRQGKLVLLGRQGQLGRRQLGRKPGERHGQWL